MIREHELFRGPWNYLFFSRRGWGGGAKFQASHVSFQGCIFCFQSHQMFEVDGIPPKDPGPPAEVRYLDPHNVSRICKKDTTPQEIWLDVEGYNDSRVFFVCDLKTGHMLANTLAKWRFAMTTTSPINCIEQAEKNQLPLNRMEIETARNEVFFNYSICVSFLVAIFERAKLTCYFFKKILVVDFESMKQPDIFSNNNVLQLSEKLTMYFSPPDISVVSWSASALVAWRSHWVWYWAMGRFPRRFGLFGTIATRKELVVVVDSENPIPKFPTTWDVVFFLILVDTCINYLWTVAGFLPSTVFWCFLICLVQNITRGIQSPFESGCMEPKYSFKITLNDTSSNGWVRVPRVFICSGNHDMTL